VNALIQNTTGSTNTATGFGSLNNNTTGNNNTAAGTGSLESNTTGFTNSAVGGAALRNNTTGAQNTAIGGEALLSNTTGNNNIGVGMSAGYNLTTGNNNIAMGLNAGSKLTTGNDDIDIGNQGVAGESGTIRIGTTGTQTATYIAGIWGRRAPRGAAVVVNSSGQLGVEESSERYKSDIAPMRPSSDKIAQLRPVTYRLKTDLAGDLQYGLIAEEVNQVYPELVVRDDAGTIEGVRYDRLAPILLNEVQQQQQELATQAKQLGELKQQLAELQELNRAMMAVIKLEAKDSRVAMR
jgi:Chaperone of endosialidase